MKKIFKTWKGGEESTSPTLTTSVEVMGYSIPIHLEIIKKKRVLGYYTRFGKRIVIDPSKHWETTELANTIAHECHHWIVQHGSRELLQPDRRRIRLHYRLICWVIVPTVSIVVSTLSYWAKEALGVSSPILTLVVQPILTMIATIYLLRSRLAYRLNESERTANEFAEKFGPEFMEIAERVRLMWRLTPPQ